MSFDGIFLHQVKQELQELETGRITKVQSPYENEIILTVRAKGKNHKLLLCTHAQYARIQCTTLPYLNQEQPSLFCMTLRKYIDGAFIEKIEQQGNDRVICLSLTRRDEIGDQKYYQLILEIMGRHSNLLLVEKETNKIIDCLKHVGIHQNSYRTLLPGAIYLSVPHQDKKNPFQMTKEEVFHFLHTEVHSAKEIQTALQGIGKDTAHELFLRLDEEKEKVTIWDQFFQELEEKKPTLTTYEGKDYLLPMPYQSLPGENEFFSSYSELLDVYYGERVQQARVQQQIGDIAHRLRHIVEKNTLKIQKLEEQLSEASDAEKWRQYGELLTTYLHLVPKGATEVSLPNYYDEEGKDAVIPLDPAYSPNKNAQKYFQKYQKLKKSVKIVQQQIAQTKEENQYLESVLAQMEIATPEDLPAIQEELYAQGFLKEKKHRRMKTKKSQPLQFRTSQGTPIYVGRNNLQNDELSLKKAQKNDYWLHAKNIPGSHVILKTSTPTDEEIVEAATLAAYYSKYQKAANVPVDYIQVKHLRKPNGSKPGFVVYEGQKSTVVTPTKEKVEALKDE